jgi:hypothetical protein
MRKSSASARRPGRAQAVVRGIPSATPRQHGNGAAATVAARGNARVSTRNPRVSTQNARVSTENARANGSGGSATRPDPERQGRRDRRPPSPAAEPVAMTSRGLYVYCIIEAPDRLRFGPIGIGADPSEVFSVHYRNLAAIVSDAPLEVIDSTRENVLAHERVNEAVMRDHTVIPMSFGTIFKTREDIVQLLRSAAEAFGDVLSKMQNKLEFGLKVLWDRDQAIREVESEDEDIGRLKKEISGQNGPTYFARMQYGRLVDAALQSRSERYMADILDRLRDVSVASRINKPIGDKMIMNAAFLISREDEAAFDARVKAIASKLDQLTFKYSGPWPPYNFVNIRLKLERA